MLILTLAIHDLSYVTIILILALAIHPILIQILNLIDGEGAQEGAVVVNLTWKRLANRIAGSTVVRTLTYNGQKYEKSAPGQELLNYLMNENLAQTRDAALALCTR